MNIDQFISREIIPSTQHKTFYHFTDRRNLPQIREHGILSMAKLKAAAIKIPAPGGNQWSFDADEASGMDKYVHLCFTTNHPMVFHAVNDGRIKELIYLRIKPEVIRLPGVMVTRDVSNQKGVIPEPVQAIADMDHEVIYKRTNWKIPEVLARLKAAERYEILVPNQVPIELVINPNG